MKKQRNALFDIAKCIAMYFVVLGHLLNERLGDPTVLINFFHMHVMFLISGYFARYSVEKHAPKEIMARKVRSLLVPYFIWSAVSLMANASLSLLQGNLSVSGILTEATEIFIYARSVWVLIELFITFLLFLAIHSLIQRMKLQKYWIAVYCAAYLILLLIPDEIFAFYKFKWLFPFFLAGYLVSSYRNELREWINSGHKKTVIQVLSLSFPLLAVLCFNTDAFWRYTRFDYSCISDMLYGVLYYLISAVGVMMVFSISEWLSKCSIGGVLADIGTYSMDIYVIHMFIIKFIPVPVDLTKWNHLAACVFFSIVSLAVVILIYLLCKLFLRKIKLYNSCVGV